MLVDTTFVIDIMQGERDAIENHQPLLTRNRKDFSGISELKVEGY